jgi:ribosome-associated protein
MKKGLLLNSTQLAGAIARAALTKKADDVVVMDLRKLSPVADFFVICSADSEVQVRAIADAVEERMERRGARVWHREAGSLNWFVLDYVDVVLHVFHKNTRSYYSLEKLWGDAKVRRVSEAPARPAVRVAARRRRTGAHAAVKRKAS